MIQKEVRLEDILPMIWQLPETEREQLRQILKKERIAQKKEKPKLPSKRRLSELKGLGKEIWQKVDVAKYLDEERDSWQS